jgi:hypothetical protein
LPGKGAHITNEKQHEALKDEGMSKERAAKIANSPDASEDSQGRLPARPDRGDRETPRPEWILQPNPHVVTVSTSVPALSANTAAHCSASLSA